MRQIGIRELRQHASVWLRRVQLGEVFEVTDKGRPVAMLAPLPPGDELERLIGAGRVVPAQGDVLQLGPPLTPEPGLPLPSVVLEQARADGR